MNEYITGMRNNSQYASVGSWLHYSPGKTECKTIHLSELWDYSNSETAIYAHKRKATKNDVIQILPKAQSWTIKCKLHGLYYCILTFTQECFLGSVQNKTK